MHIVATMSVLMNFHAWMPIANARKKHPGCVVQPLRATFPAEYFTLQPVIRRFQYLVDCSKTSNPSLGGVKMIRGGEVVDVLDNKADLQSPGDDFGKF